MGRSILLPIFAVISIGAVAQQPSTPARATQSAPDSRANAAAPDTAPLPPIGPLLLDVERNQQAAEKRQDDYTYHVHSENQELNGKGSVKKYEVIDSESVSIDGVRVNRIVARDGKPLTPDEQTKESERIDKEVAKFKERKAKAEGKGEETDPRGNVVITASRILELGTFSNPRRTDLNGRPTIVADYAGDPKAKTHNVAEGVIRDLVGTVWIDEKDRVLVRGEGHFLNDFKIGGGLVLDVHKGLSFTFQATKVNGDVWLPASVDAQGSARYLLFGGVNGKIRVVTSDYRRFRSTSTIVGSSDALGPDDQPIADPPSHPPQR